MDCNGKGMNIGKSETMNVGLQYPARERRFEVRKEKRKRGHVDDFSSVRNVRFGILVGWLSANSAKIDFVPFLPFTPVPPHGMRRFISINGTRLRTTSSARQIRCAGG